jgi:hypothetical protein
MGRRAGLALPPTETSRSLLIKMSWGKLACQSRPPKPALDFRAIRPLLLPETLAGANFGGVRRAQTAVRGNARDREFDH